MITEDRVSCEIAKLLKEKGFDIACEYQYINCSSGYPFLIDIRDDAGNFRKNSDIGNDEYSAPTQSLVVKWLRIKHNILLFLLPAQENGKLVYHVEVWTWYEAEGIYKSTYAPMLRKEPEQAVEAAIKYCLENLI